MFGSILESMGDTIDDIISDPIGAAFEMAVQPIVDGCDLLDGLTEGEFRYKAAMRLGADVVAGMTIDEVVEAMID